MLLNSFQLFCILWKFLHSVILRSTLYKENCWLFFFHHFEAQTKLDILEMENKTSVYRGVLGVFKLLTRTIWQINIIYIFLFDKRKDKYVFTCHNYLTLMTQCFRGHFHFFNSANHQNEWCQESASCWKHEYLIKNSCQSIQYIHYQTIIYFYLFYLPWSAGSIEKKQVNTMFINVYPLGAVSGNEAVQLGIKWYDSCTVAIIAALEPFNASKTI